MEAPRMKCVKIGIAEHSVEQRQKSIQTGCPEKIGRVWCSRNIPDYKEVEKALHLQFFHKQTNGEWFRIPFLEAAEEADRLCRSGSQEYEIERLKNQIEELKKELCKANEKLRTFKDSIEAEYGHRYTVAEFVSALSSILESYLQRQRH